MTSLRKRKLKVTFHMPGGDVIVDESFNLRIHARKDCLSSQNDATIDLTNLTQQFRQELLSQFTAFNRRKTASNQITPVYLDMEIAAGYLSDDGTDTTSTIYHGQVVECGLVQGPPNITIRIKCYTHQVNKVAFIDQPPPYNTTFKELVLWAGGVMGFDEAHIKCDTKYDGNIVSNAARSTAMAGDLPLYLEQFYRPDVAAFIDDNFLIVKDRYKVLNPSDTVTLNEFIGIPCWNEWGAEGTVFMDPAIKLAQAANFVPTQNPSLNGVYVVMSIDYELTSRDAPFYCHVNASPAA
ncbi:MULTISPECIES: baseplate hub protein [unclassified Caballeronia]|uniref:baseplate hub protein n=1 Tax=unclassified Caballeronia TaxID=2646786 RepID=UPI00285C4E02|nr:MULTISPECIES: hypothetical protein [unclassified Caballeronia]MDR5751128.1 hypothetical protein [Caballeronia sp. LZ024]MDR5844735.1 hypothetical protein [Caballeronia sp. LZ031]